MNGQKTLSIRPLDIVKDKCDSCYFSYCSETNLIFLSLNPSVLYLIKPEFFVLNQKDGTYRRLELPLFPHQISFRFLHPSINNLHLFATICENQMIGISFSENEIDVSIFNEGDPTSAGHFYNSDSVFSLNSRGFLSVLQRGLPLGAINIPKHNDLVHDEIVNDPTPFYANFHFWDRLFVLENGVDFSLNLVDFFTNC